MEGIRDVRDEMNVSLALRVGAIELAMKEFTGDQFWRREVGRAWTRRISFAWDREGWTHGALRRREDV